MARSSARSQRLLVGIAVSSVAILVAAVGGCGTGVPRHESAGCPGDPMSGQPEWSQVSTAFAAPYDQHPFVGNGYLGLRVPPAGMGYLETGEQSGWPLYTPRYDGAFAAGLYGRDPEVAAGRTAIAALPNWSALLVGIGDETYSPTVPAAQVSNFRQVQYLRCGLVRTELTWHTRAGRAVDLVYEVLANRVDPHTAAVRLSLTPHFTGGVTVTGLVDLAGARRLRRTAVRTPGAATVDVEFHTAATDVEGDVVSVLAAGDRPVRRQGTAQRVDIAVAEGNSYEIVEYIGVDTALTAPHPGRAATAAATRLAAGGWATLLDRQSAAWRALWASDIEIPGRPDMQRWVRSAEYALYSATNDRQDNSISPTGLSSDNYAGLIFWDADIWMFPGLLELAPPLARSIVEYRYKTLPAARENARRLGYPGAFYPWTSAATGDLWTDCHSWAPPHCLTQIHLQGDIALAVWQYYLATGDSGYLRQRAWPILSDIAEFWSARATPNPDGSYSIRDVAGPDEYSNGVDDGVYTNAVAAESLWFATRTAHLLGEAAPGAWAAIAARLRVPFDDQARIFLQYDGYRGSRIKQADAVLLEYPLQWPMSDDVARRTLDYYADRTDPDGPAMTDSVHAIDAAENGEPGCAVSTYMDRSARPFVREPFGQFAESRGGKAGRADPLAGAPAFGFVTLAGGYLQEFLNGLTGLRLHEDRIRLAPLLPRLLPEGVTLRGIHWRGRIFDIAVGPVRSTLTLRSGAPMTVETPDGPRRAGPGVPLDVPTRRPQLAPTADLARCGSASATSEQPGYYAEAAVNGTPGIGWRAADSSAAFTVDLGAPTAVHRIVPRWFDRPPAARFEVSTDDRIWTPVTPGPGGTLAAPVTARYVRVRVDSSDASAPPGLRELEVR
ncbi:discoidin domain-containing protein [Nocardia sp. alder85J]|uniref:discoidin domain-containing protein n=1 Tax=Nocardia sp. alder85J TaxID=2862949 RepID=UPI001CD557F1|nr:discoidin domain-containing protein [Nocardia sp. alder85J]MCX4093528.1 discoidin domain-containing protein [Nocardia sp. alder85J]